jgi:hypothetical protein
MKAYRAMKRQFYRLVTSVIEELIGKLHVPASSPPGKSPVANGYERACVPHSVCGTLETKSFAAAENRTTIPLSSSQHPVQ